MGLLTILLGIIGLGLFFILKHLMQNRKVIEKFGVPILKPFLCFGSPPFNFHQFNVREFYVEQCKKHGKTWAFYNGISIRLKYPD